ncbi:MAG: hypothetical protein HY369_00300 [Candidatus Aenigmarchaeota archaeon]|nr:hypothetical protein [Candidatus Aenigmarchaeota archaeon]
MDDLSCSLVKEDSLVLALARVVRDTLTDKQLRILTVLQKEPATASSLVRRLSIELACSRSSLWASLGGLREAGMIEGNRGDVLSLTALGKIILEVQHA